MSAVESFGNDKHTGVQVNGRDNERRAIERITVSVSVPALYVFESMMLPWYIRPGSAPCSYPAKSATFAPRCKNFEIVSSFALWIVASSSLSSKTRERTQRASMRNAATSTCTPFALRACKITLLPQSICGLPFRQFFGRNPEHAPGIAKGRIFRKRLALSLRKRQNDNVALDR